ncbi:hypothetical protein GCM10009682_54450 [Luedemannella flava]|uniref:Uncharacterized protein n=1 Tax=Luedemannella flava TaxID=349316 RepID=A0ABP4YRE9_9ACTN
MADGVERANSRRIIWWIAAGAALATVAVVAVGVIAFLGARGWGRQTGSFVVGTCFNTGDETGLIEADGLREVAGRAYIVDCGTDHDAELTRTAERASECAAEGAWLKSLDQIYCVRLRP